MFLGGIGRQKYLLCGLFAVMILSSFFVLVPMANAMVEGQEMNPGVVLQEGKEGAAAGTLGAVGEKAGEKVAAVGGLSAVGGAVAEAVVTVLSYFVNFLLKTISLCSHLIIGVASYNNFVNETAIVNAWKIVRDIANMFFVVVFLVIAIGTILGIGSYSYKKALPRLLLMAVLINFSRTIAGVIIDFGQVVMLTFVNAFHDTAAGNFINGLGLNDVWKVNMSVGERVSQFAELVFSYFLAALVVIVAFVVMVVMLVVLVFRIVMLWMLLAISPLAFFAWAVPGKTFSGYFDRWWKMFVGNVISGPLLAFFLWLALTVMATSDKITGSMVEQTGMTIGGENTEAMLALGSTTLGTEPVLLKYLISIGMLVGGLMLTQELKVIGSGFAGDALKWMEKTGKSLSKRGAMAPLRAADEKFRVRERGYGLVSRVPGFAGIGMRGAAKVRTEKAARMGKQASVVANATPEELERLLKTKPVTAEGRDLKALATQKALQDYKYQGNKEKEFKDKSFAKYKAQGLSDDDANTRAEADTKVDMKSHMGSLLSNYEDLAKSRGDRKMESDAYAIKQSRPDWMSQGEPHAQRVKDIQKVTQLMSPVDARNKISSAAIEDQAVWEAMSDDQKTFIEQKGNAAQKSAVEKMRMQSADYREKHPETIADAAERTRVVQGLGNNVVNMSPEALKDKGVVGAMTNNQIDELVKAGKLEVGALDVGRLTANNGALAGRIAEQGGPEMVNRAAQTFGANFSAALGSYLAQPRTTPLTAEQETKVRSAQFIASSDAEKSFDYNRTTRQFNTPGGQDSFLSAVGDPKQVVDIVSRLDVNVMAENGYQNHMAEGVAMGVSVSALKKMMASGMDADLMRTIKEAIISTAKADPTDKSLQDKARYVNNAVGFSEL